jgi:penicillin-binding protein 1A
VKKGRVLRYLVLLIVLSGVFAIFGSFIYVMGDIPAVENLKNLRNTPPSVVYGVNDQVMYLLVPENRIFVPYNRIPKYVRDAFLAAEDADFFKHGAVDFSGVLRAFWKNMMSGRVVQGGSTITQQVIKSMLLGPERSISRKVREAILAYKLERYLSKQEILNLYLNNVYLGHGVYGVEAASQVYFGRHVGEISRGEGALLAGIVQAPSRYTPKRHPGNARVRQEYVIAQMYEKGFVDAKTKAAMTKEKIHVREDNGVFAESYYKDYIIKYLEDKYGKGILSRSRLKIYAAVDPQFQKIAEESLRRGLDIYGQRKGDYVFLHNLSKAKWKDFAKSTERDLRVAQLKQGTAYRLLVTEKGREGYIVQVGREKGLLEMSSFPFVPGDVTQGLYAGKDGKHTNRFQPVRSVRAEGALVCMDVKSGLVYAMVGGRDPERSPFNRAVNAKIQSGSAFKPFIYVTALKRGYTPDSVLVDEPKAYPSGTGTWTPRNYDGKYDGTVSMRDAVAYSKNAATVRLLEEIGVGALKQTIQDLGIDADLPNNLSIALGTSNLTLLDLVKGFAAFGNGGFRVKPVFIRKVEDDRGTLLEQHGTERARVLSEDVAAKMNTLLKGPLEYGTAKGASRLGYPLAGKTGTTSNYNDALFVGYSPHIITGVWVGFDARGSLGRGESGARVCLPIWMSFMGSALRRYPPDDFVGGPEVPML